MAENKDGPTVASKDRELVELAHAMHGVWGLLTTHRADCGVKSDRSAHGSPKGTILDPGLGGDEPTARPYEGTPKQGVWAMGVLAGGPLRMSELAEKVGSSLASMSGVVDRLEARGFVARTQSQVDRRVVTVELTEAGQAAMLAFRRDMTERLRAVVAPLDTAELAELTRLLKKLC